MTEDKVHEEIALFNEWFGSLECENKPEPLRLLMQLAWLGAKEQAAEQGGWISVEEKLPTEDEQYVLVWETVDGNSGAEQAFFNLPEKTFVNFAGDILKATHWQPLSAPPEKE